jgi:hypothetical protein
MTVAALSKGSAIPAGRGFRPDDPPIMRRSGSADRPFPYPPTEVGQSPK